MRKQLLEDMRSDAGKESVVMKKLSFVIPCYCSELTIESVVHDIFEVMENYRDAYEFEVLLVNDCSTDQTYQVIQKLAEQYDHVCGFNLSVNFGQQGALMAGFSHVTGNAVICLDDDGQTSPGEVGRLIGKYEEGYDVVYARYSNKKHSLFRNFGSRVNDIMAHLLLNKPKDLYVSSFYIADRYVIDEVVKYKNPYPYIMGLILRITHNIANVDVEHKERMAGDSGYTMGKLIKLWLNGFTAFSVIPLRAATFVGTILSVLSFAYLIYTVVRWFIVPDVLMGWSSTISAILLVGGVLMIMLGMLGEYIGRMYISLNNSPQYIIKESTLDEETD